MRLILIAIYHLFLTFSLFAQSEGSLDFLMPGNEKPKTKSEKDRELAISETKKRLIRDRLDQLTDREIDEYLESLGLSTEGSIFTRRRRLRQLLGSDSPKKTNSAKELPDRSGGTGLPIQIENATEGELISIDKTDGGVLILRGKVKMKVQNGTLEANLISIDSDRQEIYAEGGIIFRDGNAIIEGDKFIYDFRLEKGIIYKTKGSFYPAFFMGEKIKRLDNQRFMLEMGYFTACNAERPHYSFKASKIIVYEDKTMAAIFPRFEVGMLTIPFPFYYGTSLGNGVQVRAGRNNTQGFFVRSTYRWSVPTSSLILPMGYSLGFDYYEKTGQAVRTEFWKQTPWLNYTIELGYANYKENQVVSSYQNRLQGLPVGNTYVTNSVDKGPLLGQYQGLLPGNLQGLRKYGTASQPWFKQRIFLNSKMNDTTLDVTRNVMLRYENFSNAQYEYQFGNRFQPINTLQSFYSQRNQHYGFVRRSLNWQFDYTESRGGLMVNVNMQRNLLWYMLSNGAGTTSGGGNLSGYFPTMDTLPRTTIKNLSQIATLPYFSTPVYWEFLATNTLTRYFGYPQQKSLPTAFQGLGLTNYNPYRENLLRTESFTVGETGLRTTMNFGSYVSLQPTVYVGAQKQSLSAANGQTVAANTSRQRMLQRYSYEYARTDDNLRIGTPMLYFNAQYLRTQAYKPELSYNVISNARQNELHLSIESHASQYWDFSLMTIRDLRTFNKEYQPTPTSQQRWYYTVARISGFVDFLDDFRLQRASLLEKKRGFYSGIYMNNDFVYHTPLHMPLSNNFTLAYKMGGFALPFIRLFRSLEVGGTWYHVYFSPILDRYRFYFRITADITKHIAFRTELDSRVTQPWQYTSNVPGVPSNFYAPPTSPYSSGINYMQVNPITDIVNSTGVNGISAKQKSAFNINHLLFALKYNAHNMNIEMAYSMDLRTWFGGPTASSQLTFYDQSVYLNFEMANVNLGAQQGTESTRMRIFRFRKKPMQAGYESGISSQGQ